MRLKTKLKIEGYTYFVLFIASIFLANYFIGHIGTICNNGVCVVPVGFGFLAPSGVLIVGVAFTLRDMVHRRLGKYFTMVAIVIGAALSAFLSPALALASGVAFLLSESLDLFVYIPLAKRNLMLAVLGSNIVGLIVDSSVFLFLAFGSLNYIQGQVLGKFWMTLLALPVVYIIRNIDRKRGIHAEI